MSDADTAKLAKRLALLRSYVKQDPSNGALRRDAIVAAYETGDDGLVRQLVEEAECYGEVPDDLLNFSALSCLRSGQADAASALFEPMLRRHPEDPVLKLNLAWARLALGQDDGVAELLTDDVTSSLNGAAALKVRALHGRGQLTEALAYGKAVAADRPRDQDLAGAMASVAIDLGELELAAAYARQAGGSADGLAAAGMLLLNDEQPEQARALFDRGLEAQPSNGRAWLGKGLAALATNDISDASVALDRAADLFKTHLGSWVAAGWCHFVAGEMKLARARFEQAVALDPTFAEAQGSLAVAEIRDGDIKAARVRTEVALRLDCTSFSGALAKSLLLAAEGHQDAALRIRQLAMRQVVGTGGKTLGQALADMTRKR